MPDDKSNLYRAIHYSGAPDSAIMRAEEEAEWAAESEAEAMREGRVDERTLYHWLERHRGRVGIQAALREITVSLASLLLLRWLEAVEDEEAAIAEFEGAEYHRSLIPTHTLPHWLAVPPHGLTAYLETVILPELKLARGTDYSVYANRLVYGMESFCRLDPAVQTDLVRHAVAIEPGDPSGRSAGSQLFETAFEWQLRKGKGGGGEYRTPHDLAWLMAKLVDPAPGDRVYDPCFGTGALLVEAAHRKRAHASRVDSELWGRMQRNGIYGRELDPAQYLIGLVRVVYSGIDLPRLELGDSLETPPGGMWKSDAGFDCIVANPPFGLKVSRRAAEYYPIPMPETEGLFLQHIIHSLKPGGRAVVLVSPGMLSNEGRWVRLREFLVESNLVEQVIGLPAGLLKPYTMIAPSLLVLRKGRRSGAIRFSRLRAPKPIDDELVPLTDDEDDEWKEEFSYELTVEECAKRGYDLRVRDRSSQTVEDRIRDLVDRYAEVELHKLGQLCDVVPGVARKTADTTADRDHAGPNPVGLLRISDIIKGEIRKPALYLRPGSPQLDRTKASLRPGDLVLSTKGTIGKVAVVPHLSDPVYAAEGLTILRPESPIFLRDYLFEILNSGTYRELLAGMSSGTTLQHLRHSDVRNLPIPVPPVPIQDLVCIDMLGTDTDALATLKRILERGEENPLVEWMEYDTAIQELLDLATSKVPTDRQRILESAAESALRILQFIGEQPNKLSIDFAEELFFWLRALVEATSGLRKVSRIQNLSEQFAAIHLSRIRLSYAEHVLKKMDGGLWGRARQISNAFRALIEAEASGIKSQQVVSCDTPNTVPRNEEATATIVFNNQGPLPLRDVKVTEAFYGTELEVAYWEPNSSFSFEIDLQPDLVGTNENYHALTFEVEATHLDETPYVTEIPLPVYVAEAVYWYAKEDDELKPPSWLMAGLSSLTDLETRERADLGPSPYNAGSPVKNESMLFGRDSILRLVQRQLQAKDRPNVILLEGNRRTGKTSILKRLEKGDLLPDWVVVYCSLQKAEGSEVAGLKTAEIWRLIAKDIGFAILRDGFTPPLPGGTQADPGKPFKVQFTHACRETFDSEHPFELFEEFLQLCLEAVSPKRIVLMLDEFDKLQEGIESGVTSPQVPENLRYLIHEYPAFSAILTGSRRLKRLREEYWSALFGFGHREGVSALPQDDAMALVTQPVSGQLEYHPDAAEEIVRTTAAQPFLIQNLCNRIYEVAAESGKRRIDLQMVRQSIETFVEGSEHFRHFWGCAETERRRLVLSLIQRTESDREGSLMTLPLLEQTLGELRVPIPRGERIADDLTFLREFEMIRLVGKHPNQHYEIEVPLFGRWIAEQEDFDETVRRAIEEGENLAK